MTNVTSDSFSGAMTLFLRSLSFSLVGITGQGCPYSKQHTSLRHRYSLREGLVVVQFGNGIVFRTRLKKAFNCQEKHRIFPRGLLPKLFSYHKQPTLWNIHLLSLIYHKVRLWGCYVFGKGRKINKTNTYRERRIKVIYYSKTSNTMSSE